MLYYYVNDFFYQGLLRNTKGRIKEMKKKGFAVLLSVVFLFVGCGELLPSSGSSSGTLSGVCAHMDTNHDDVCDFCQESVAVTFDFFAINDLHGKFEDTDSQPGVDELTTYFKQARAKNENTIVLSSGDMWQGASASNLTNGAIMTEWMNEIGVTSMTLGNHEFDWGETAISCNADLAQFPFLALNIYEKSTNRLPEYCQPSVTLEKNGVKIGIIGAIGDCYSSISADKTSNVYFKTGTELTDLVKAESEKLRSEGADFILYSVHDGYGYSSNSGSLPTTVDYYDTALSNGYVNLVFEGHTHRHYVLKDSKGVYHLQGGGDNDGISHAEVKINYANDTFEVQTAEFIDTSVYERLADDPIVDTLLEKYIDRVSLADKEVGYNFRLRESTEILNTCARLYCEAGLKKWGDRYDIVLGGAFMTVRAPYQISAGMVKYGDLQNVLPFDNELVLGKISGYKLRTQFIKTDNQRYYISLSDYGKSVADSIQDSATYYIVTDTYSSTYAYNGITEIERYDSTTFARDLLAAYIEQGGWRA